MVALVSRRRGLAMRPLRWAAMAFAGVVATSISFGGEAAAQDRGSETTVDEENRAKVELLRAEIANQVQLHAFDLLDELVFSWKEAPPFASSTLVILADVVAPVSYGSGFEALIENHIAQLLIANAEANMALAHCPACHALLVHSGESGTVISRGVDQPKSLAKLRGQSGAEYALFLDFEAEGTSLVLRARVTRLDDELRIVYARTMTTRLSPAPLLRKSSRLVSAEQAREDYEALLDGRGPIAIPVRMVLSAFAPNTDGLGFPIPIPWLQAGAELSLGQARAWTGSLMVGATFLPQFQSGIMVQARFHRLLTGSSYSLTSPNLYASVGVALAGLAGPGAALLVPVSENPITNLLGSFATYPSVQAGLELRFNQRISACVIIESMPTLWTSDNVGNWSNEIAPEGIDLSFLPVNSVGMEVSFIF